MLDLRTLKRNLQEGTLGFKEELDLSFVKVWSHKPFSQPVSVVGTLARLEAVYKLDYTASYTSALPCARCLNLIERRLTSSFSHILGDNSEESLEEQYLNIANEQLDLAGLVSSDILTDFDHSPLCKEDCKGLCPTCGVEQNQSRCDCAAEPTIDPRFEVLRELLGK